MCVCYLEKTSERLHENGTGVTGKRITLQCQNKAHWNPELLQQTNEYANVNDRIKCNTKWAEPTKVAENNDKWISDYIVEME